MNQFKLGKNILILSILTLLTVFSWIGFEIYRAYTKTTVPKIIQELIKPLNPAINRTAIEEIEKQFQPSEEELNILPTPISSPTPETEEQTTTGQTATQGGSLE